MIPVRHYPLIERFAKLALRSGPEGERMVSELCGQLRNSARDASVAPLTAARATEQLASIQGILDRHRRRHGADDGSATPETKAKRRRDCIGALVKAGSLSDVQANAADQLARGHGLIAGDVAMKQFPYRPPTSASVPKDWAGWQIRCNEQYIAWFRRMDEEGRDPDPIMYLILEASGLREAEREFHMTNGSLLTQFQEAMNLYMQIAGWREVA